MKNNHLLLLTLIVMPISLYSSKATRQDSKLSQTANSFKINKKRMIEKSNLESNENNEEENNTSSDEVTVPLDDHE